MDYAVNRTYDSKQGRFTQVDPIGMGAVSFMAPQTLNMYTYCGNDPVNHTDPSGLFFGRLFRWIGKHLKKIFTAIAIVVAIVAVVAFPWSAPVTLKAILGLVSALASAASSVSDLLGLKTLSKVFGIIAMAAGIAALGFEVKNAWDKLKKLRSKIFSFADDPPSIGGFYVEVRGFWDKLTSAVSSVSNQISIALGLSNLTQPLDAKSGGGSGAPNDDTNWPCVRKALGRYAVESVKNLVLFETGKSLVAGGLLLGRFFVRHAGRAPSSSLPAGTAINNLSSIKEVGLTPGGMIIAGGGSMGHAVKSQYYNLQSAAADGKRCGQAQ